MDRRNPYLLLVRIQISTAIVEISLVISQEIKNTTAVRPSYFTWANTQRTPHPYIEIVTPYAYSCFIHYSKKNGINLVG